MELTEQDNELRSRALATRLWLACLAMQEQISIYLGLRLGLYEALATPATVPELVRRAGVAPRYAREWLEQQAVCGLLTVDDPALGPEARRYTLPAGHRTVLTVSDHPASIASLAVLPFGGVAAALPHLLEAYRTGAGVPDEVYGEDWRDGHSGANRALFATALPGWIRMALGDVHARLLRAGARVADVGCGAGWASIAIARAYPEIRVDGMDIDAATVAAARRNVADAGLTDRVSIVNGDAGDAGLPGTYDLVCVLDTLHELPRPVEVLRACRKLCADGGVVVVMDARVAARFTAPGDEVERFQYGTSLLHCLPACLADEPSAGTGTVMRPDQVRAFGAEAGFASVRELPVQERFHRLYRLDG